MRLTAYSNYSMRILMYCAMHPGQLVRIQDVATAFDISKAHLLKAARHLGQLGYLSTVRGRSGGIQLGMAAERIDIGAVIRAVEDSGEFVECFNSSTNSCPIAGTCKLTGLFRRGLEAFYQELDGVTLADLVGTGTELRSRLPLLELA
ncbi:RrF2 family transcriptional regulator [Congregibacter litoralis]|uniref:Transcriptional regulator, BadM/Rrf2 family n=1 Tax=Congregibacter litoralis KT71 TaxID=314285 RepID=A4ADA9_9GAMM|nr:Rrf2 family transcriptional regulator [Congregibacter litoralis]EAQ96033.1 transcriptional regulator, BadM/Rrf2 family [Congregibacter litoralis KT71]